MSGGNYIIVAAFIGTGFYFIWVFNRIPAIYTVIPPHAEHVSKFSSLKSENVRTPNVKGQTIPDYLKNKHKSTSANENLNKTTFTKFLENFEWKIVQTKNSSELNLGLEKLILQLSDFVAMEPRVPINTTCLAPALPISQNINCSKYPTAFNGNRRLAQHGIKIGVIIQFGFDVDVLEIYLNELYDVVDQFFIIEATRAHNSALAKPLMWEKVQFQPRFSKFIRKVTHFVIDDAESEEIKSNLEVNLNHHDSHGDIWLMEGLQEILRWRKFLEWNNASRFFSGEDLLGFGDADEIPSRHMVHLLKFCELKSDEVDFGIWFPFGNINYAFSPDYPVKDHKYTLGDPGFWKLHAAITLKTNDGSEQIPTRTHGRGPSYLLGGMHMTHDGYLPFLLIKQITATEGGPLSLKKIRTLSRTTAVDLLRKLESHVASVPKQDRGRLANLTDIADKMKEIAILPWFYACNKERYPVWEGRPDSRLYVPV